MKHRMASVPSRLRIDDNKLWDWRREVCTYHEDHSWTAVDVVRSPDRIDA